MNTDPWRELAAVLDKIPHGFTPADDDSHISLLKWIFDEEEARLASRMKLRGETIEEMSQRLGREPVELRELLERMASKGQIRAWNSSTGRRYCLMPYVIGIFEEQLGRMDEEFAKLMVHYLRKTRGGSLFSTNPPIFKVIPINRVISTELEIYPYQVAEKILDSAKAWGLRECICKKRNELEGNECKYPKSVCLVFARKENVFEEDELTTPISKERAIEILREAEEAGLVHCSMNIQTGHNYICNCCTCCCLVLRGLTELGQPTAFAKSDFLMHVDEELCTACGTCVERCQFNALSLEDVCVVDIKRCVGCGVCAIACPEGAMSLVNREGEILRPPESFLDWMTQKAMARGVDPSDLL